MERRLPNGANGDRDGRGRFRKGCAPGPGNPHSGQVAKLRGAMLRAVSESDIEAAVKALVQQTKKGNVAAVRELLDRCVGKPTEADLIERIERLEAAMMEGRKP